MSMLNTLEFKGLKIEPLGFWRDPYGIHVKSTVYGKAPDPLNKPGCSIYLCFFLGSLAPIRYRDCEVTLYRKAE
jgi:hypothetical protein